MEKNNRAIEIERLRKRLSEAIARKTALLEEAQELFARLHDIRAAFGNPFSYSQPEQADESAANDTGYRSHEITLPTVLALSRVEDEIRETRKQLEALGLGL